MDRLYPLGWRWVYVVTALAVKAGRCIIISIILTMENSSADIGTPNRVPGLS